MMDRDVDMLIGEVERIISADGERDEKLKKICTLLHDRVEHYDWVGFYLVDREEERMLVLGPFRGEETEHTRIPFGSGICGQAAETGELFLVPDVANEKNYLSCSEKVRSEIVVPIVRGSEMVGELDIDSHRIDPFTEPDRVLLERICQMVSDIL
ncbi:hypothetical protein B6U90_00730 [Thermoplasmatales archaeon ex4484_6]|nr:MAG: hypothetical protein B6U90_00730 [Thermoplasmatales archaeon ex4484_6]RLF68299.1 MAG: GAF domain-containing protein [Thermoplasmata archaeon]